MFQFSSVFFSFFDHLFFSFYQKFWIVSRIRLCSAVGINLLCILYSTFAIPPRSHRIHNFIKLCVCVYILQQLYIYWQLILPIDIRVYLLLYINDVHTQPYLTIQIDVQYSHASLCTLCISFRPSQHKVHTLIKLVPVLWFSIKCTYSRYIVN